VLCCLPLKERFGFGSIFDHGDDVVGSGLFLVCFGDGFGCSVILLGCFDVSFLL